MKLLSEPPPGLTWDGESVFTGFATTPGRYLLEFEDEDCGSIQIIWVVGPLADTAIENWDSNKHGTGPLTGDY